jgi:hypothetical protein
VISSIYSGYNISPTLGSLLAGTAWATGDGAVRSFLFASIYNWFVEKEPQPRYLASAHFSVLFGEFRHTSAKTPAAAEFLRPRPALFKHHAATWLE